LANIQSTLSYAAHDAFLNVNILFSTPNGPLNVNQQNVANALTNYFNRNGGKLRNHAAQPVKTGTIAPP